MKCKPESICFVIVSGINFFTHNSAYRVWKQKETNIYIIHYVRFVKRNSTVPMN